MKATELRIGNWVEWNYEESSDGNAYPVEYGYELDDIKNNPNIVKPIPLTEGWLEGFGFEYDENDDWFVFESNKGVSFSMDKNGVMYYFGNLEPLWVDILSKIKYVHQLQNLYFALTGEELQTEETDQKVN
jgi:hypothetical protein